MTNDEIIDMAREAGINYRELSDEFATGNGDGVEIEQMQAFAKLVEDKYREPLHLALAELYRHATDTESGEKAIAAVEGALNEDK